VNAHPFVDVHDVGHDYPRGKTIHRVLDKVGFTAAHGEVVCIVGPSGVGKTTLLRSIGGLQRPTRGQVTINGAALDGPSSLVGLVFQDYSRSLFPWLSVLDNVTLPLRGRCSRAERTQRGRDALREVGLLDAETKRPWELSGGMQQRVAIARALVYQPAVLLMDEPFASVDAQTRAGLEDLVLRVRADLDQTVILITHDIDEATYLADRVIVLYGSPASVIAEIPVPLGTERDQVTTRSTPDFAQLRAEVHQFVRRGQQPTPHHHINTREQPCAS
jgi:NitT/TauT family transport system ATP-binding protein